MSGRECFGNMRRYVSINLYTEPIFVWNFQKIVQVRDMETMKRYTFFNNQWLDVGEEDGLISRKVEKSAKSDLKDFNFVFQQTARQNLYDGHIWLSIFTRPATSTFTRCQRVSTCFSLLLTTMLANAMFYTGGKRNSTW